MTWNEKNPPYGITMTGKVREHNEDSFLYTAEKEWVSQLAIVCDGIGGSMHGEIASRLACQYFYEIWLTEKAMFFENVDRMGIFMRETLNKVNRKIFTLNQSSDFADSQMGTTLVAAAFMPKDIVIIHVGDSRFYDYRSNGKLMALTADHTFLRKNRELFNSSSKFDFANSDFCNLITKSVGPTENILDDDPKAPILSILKRRNDSRYILCSDGLNHMISDDKIMAVLKNTADNRKAVNKLIAAVYGAGAIDNISIVLY